MRKVLLLMYAVLISSAAIAGGNDGLNPPENKTTEFVVPLVNAQKEPPGLVLDFNNHDLESPVSSKNDHDHDDEMVLDFDHLFYGTMCIHPKDTPCDGPLTHKRIDEILSKHPRYPSFMEK